MAQPVSAAQIAKLPISGLPLSARLYRQVQQTSMEVESLVKAHAKGMHDARALAIRLYDGYNPKDGIQRPIERRSMAKLPKPLRDLLKLDPKLKGSYETLLAEVQQAASILKTGALKAAYTELIDNWIADKGKQSLERKLDVAFKEKTRFHANRIAQTELARAHQDKVGSEFMQDDTISVVQVVMALGHPLTDICDYHAKANLFNLGPGCYPKAKAPKPVFHPFCRCIVRSRPDLSAAIAREVPGAEAAHLRTLPIGDAARMVGSRAKLQRVLNGTSLDDVINTGKDPAYHLTRLGQLDLSVVQPVRDSLRAGIDNPVMKIHPQALPNADKATVRDSKLSKYALDSSSDKGSHKALLFKKFLGYDLSNYATLIDQLKVGVVASPAKIDLLDQHGQRYTVFIPVNGPSGRSAIVTTGWIIRPGVSEPDLLSAYIEPRRNKNV